MTSKSGAPNDAIDTESELYLFLSAVAFQLDEVMTLIDLLSPTYDNQALPPAILKSKVLDLGISLQSFISTKQQKVLAREAFALVTSKGTLTSISNYVESLTGYLSDVRQSRNLMLSMQDGTFYKGVGFWKALSGCTIAATDLIPITISTSDASLLKSNIASVDNTYCAEIVVGTAGASIINGDASPITQGIPINPGRRYYLKFHCRTSSGSGSVTPKIHWYDALGNKLGTSTGSSQSVTSTWTIKSTASWPVNTQIKVTKMQSIPTGSGTSKVRLVLDSSWYQLGSSGGFPFGVGSTVYVNNVGDVFDGTQTVTAIGAGYTSISSSIGNWSSDPTTNDELVAVQNQYDLTPWIEYEIPDEVPVYGWYNEAETIYDFVPVDPILANVSSSTDNPPAYAAIEIEFDSTGTYYVDKVLFTDVNSGTDSLPFDTPAYYEEPRCAMVYLPGKKSNLVAGGALENSSAVTSLSLATATYVTTTVPIFDPTSKMLRLVTSGSTGNYWSYSKRLSNILNPYISSGTQYGTADYARLPQGMYRISGYYKVDSGTADFNVFYSVNASITIYDLPIYKTFTATTAWKKFTLDFTTPDVNNISGVDEFWFGNFILMGQTSSTFYFDGLSLEPLNTANFYVSDYFDGTTSTDSVPGTNWYGGNSTSFQSKTAAWYPFKESKVKQLVAELPNQLPIGTPFLIYGPTGVLGSGVA